jgi:hypothetical protein
MSRCDALMLFKGFSSRSPAALHMKFASSCVCDEFVKQLL